MSKVAILLGTAVAGIVGVGLMSSAGATERGDSKGKKGSNGVDLELLAKQTTEAMRSQKIDQLRTLIVQWKSASDPETAGALSFTLEAAVDGDELPESKLDGDKGSPVLRAFALRVLQLEGRAPRLELWATAWKGVLPVLAAALHDKAVGIKAATGEDDHPNGGTNADPVPDAATTKEILAALESGDPARLRQVAAHLESLGFPEAAKDLRAAADAIEAGKAHTDTEQPSPTPKPDPKPEPKPEPHDDKHVDVDPDPVNDEKPKPVQTDRVVMVKRGEGMSQVAGRVLGSKADGLKRWRELRDFNKPYGYTKTDKLGNPVLNPGDYLQVPTTWPASKETMPGVTLGPSKGLKDSTRNELPKPSDETSAPTPSRRMVEVLKGEGVANVALRYLKGSSHPYTDADRKRLRDFNVPPYEKTPDGSGLMLNPGDRLAIPPEWPSTPYEIMGGHGSMNPRQLAAARIALEVTFRGVIDPTKLLRFQRQERILPTGTYGPQTALLLLKRFGLVPPLPLDWGPNEARARRAFADAMRARARTDSGRSDEFDLVARQALGKAVHS